MSQTDADVEELPSDYECQEGEGEEESLQEEAIVYNSEDFISTHFLSKDGTLPENIFEFHHSYGYDCKRYFNLILADEETVIFASGNFINFFNITTKEIKFRRSYLGGGLGHITKNPISDYAHIAIAENGINPPIIIYEWPTMDILHVLRGGSSRSFNHMHYSPDGMLLASQGGEPDHLITIWDWPKSKILLRTKSYVSDVHRVFFSPYVPGHLATGGLSHIKFWKMARSFTGLKLQGELGRFGKTEYTDILGIYGMPDEKVISGCSWGNILIWEAGLIKVEVFRQLRKKCHEGPIVQFDYNNGELWTVGMDGRVRVWSYDMIDQADPPDDDRVVQIEPVYDFCTQNVQFMCIRKLFEEDPDDTLFIAQDGNGGIWQIDLPTLTLEVRPSVQLFKCHAGKVMDIATSPWTTYVASLGEDGRLYLYNYLTMELEFHHQFPANGRAMIWLPLSVLSYGNEIIMAFDDGNLRLVVLDMFDTRNNPIKMNLIQVIKPHNKPVTCMSLHPHGTVLVTGGEDATIFILKLHRQKKSYVSLIPIGYINVPGIVTCLTWHHSLHHTILVGCIYGDFIQVSVPDRPQDYTKITYILKATFLKQRFTTFKSQIRRNIKIAEIEARKAAKREKKRLVMMQILKDNPGLEIDEEIYLADSESEEELEPLFIPEVPGRILWMQTTPEDNVWLSISGFDAGYIYEYNMKQTDEVPLKCTIVYDGDDMEIYSFIYNYNRKYLILATQFGQIRVVRVNPQNFRDLSDYWQISMHDNINGAIPKMCFSFDESIFFTCGHDGNMFSYIYNPENKDFKPPDLHHEVPTIKCQPVSDITDYGTLSLEEEIVKAEVDRKERVANAHKDETLAKVNILREQFEELLRRNEKLLPTQVIPRDQLEIDPRITEDLQQIIDSEMALEKRKLAYQVEKSKVAMEKLMDHCTNSLDVFPLVISNLSNTQTVNTTRQRSLSENFYTNLAVIEEKILESELRGRPPEREKVVVTAPPPLEKKKKQLEYFLLGLSPATIESKLGKKLKRTLNKYRERKEREEKRELEWEKFYASKPVEGVNHPEAVIALQQAKETIGDFKLKSAVDYKVPLHLRANKLKKFKELLETREHVAINFNICMYNMRNRKVKLIEQFKQLHAELLQVQKEIPEGQHISEPPFPTISEDEFPEKNIELDIQMPERFREERKPERPPIVPPPNKDLLEKEALPFVDVDLYEESLETPWEMEARSIRLEKKLFAQSEIIKQMQELIDLFEADFEKLVQQKYKLLPDVLFLDLHILSLHQELLVLSKFEFHENELSNNVNSNMLECMKMQDLITTTNNKIESLKNEIDTLLEKAKLIEQQFYTSILDNKFYDFLRRIFKKKYKPPKEHDPDESESESSSSSSSDESEEEETGSVDSRDFGIFKLDDSVCPKGCDKRLYDLAFSLRTERHAVELEIIQHKASIEQFRKEEEMKTKKVRILEANLQNSQDELEAFQREKQCKLNEVNKTIVLHLHQLQHVTEDLQILNIWDTLLFNKTALSRLYKRVGQLQLETLQQKAKHKVHITHLQRMTTDCKYMVTTIEALKREIKETMIQKIGCIVDIDEIEEAYLRRLAHDLRLTEVDIKSLYIEETNLWKKNFHEAQLFLSQIIKDNTAKLDLLVTISRERTELQQAVSTQQRKKQRIANIIEVAEESRDDIQKLVAIVKNQKKHLQDLRDEIKTLRTKGMPVKTQLEEPLFAADKDKEVEEVDSLDWIGYDEYVRTEYQGWTDEQRGAISKEIVNVPSVISEKTDDMAKAIITEMLEHLGIESAESTAISVWQNLLRTIMNRSSVSQIIEDLVSVLPVKIDESQSNIIEISAEKLYTLQAPEVTEEDINTCTCDTIIEIIEENVLLFEEPNETLTKVLTTLVQELPIKYLLQKTSIECIVKRLGDVLPNVKKTELIDNLICIRNPNIKEIKQLLDSILVEVFGTGLDCLYIIPDK